MTEVGTAAASEPEVAPAEIEKSEPEVAATTGGDGAELAEPIDTPESPQPSPGASTVASGKFASPAATANPNENVTDLLKTKIQELSTVQGDTEEDLKRAARAFKKHQKEIRQSLEALTSPDDKLKLMDKKYFDQLKELQRVERENSHLLRRSDNLKREKDSISSELLKTTSLKNKLEALCKELQKQNKLIISDSKRSASEEQAKRQELSAKFQSTISEISDKMDLQGDERGKQHRENELLRQKLTSFAEQIDMFSHKLHAKDLEKQLEEAKARHQAEVANQEAAKANAYKAQLEASTKTEIELRQQLALYGEKFEQFKDTLTRSNEVFATFKKEMDKMSKRIKELEKENMTVKKASTKKDAQMINLLNDKKAFVKEVADLRSKSDKLEKLCRGMQLERNGMRETVRQLKIRCGDEVEAEENKQENEAENIVSEEAAEAPVADATPVEAAA